MLTAGGDIKKKLNIGRYVTAEEAAKAADIAAIRFKGPKVRLNFPISESDVDYTFSCEKLPVGEGASDRLKSETCDQILATIHKGLNKKSTGKTPEFNAINANHRRKNSPETSETQTTPDPPRKKPKNNEEGGSSIFDQLQLDYDAFDIKDHARLNQIVKHLLDPSPETMESDKQMLRSLTDDEVNAWWGKELIMELFNNQAPTTTTGHGHGPNVALKAPQSNMKVEAEETIDEESFFKELLMLEESVNKCLVKRLK
ncbi:hypothetical protein RJ641_026433 [Dillenia turbinata]|uniref:AP2/ERF domain-containing protein n=1 Tax=Dillenia turbinata TaxID=194707 RepID=A0AAN8ZPH3_9MAGN